MTDLKEIYNQWLFAEAKLKECKKKELNLRNQICRLTLGKTIEGTVTNTATDGYIIKATAKLSRKVVDSDRLIECGKLMTDDEKSVYEWNWVPKINLANYKKFKSLFHVREQILEKPAQASLTIEKGDITVAEHDAQVNPTHAEAMQNYQDTTQGMDQGQLNQGEFLHEEEADPQVPEIEEDDGDFNW